MSDIYLIIFMSIIKDQKNFSRAQFKPYFWKAVTNNDRTFIKS